MNKASPLFLVLDTLSTAGGIAWLYQNYPSQENTGVDVATGFGLGLVLNRLFMASDVYTGTWHAALGALLGWYFFPDIVKVAAEIYFWWESL